MAETTTDKRPYRATFILDTRNTEESIDDIIEKLSGVFAGIDCEVKKVDNKGQIDFVRVTDRNFPAGTYVLFDFEGPPSAPDKLKDKLKLDKTVYRILVQAQY